MKSSSWIDLLQRIPPEQHDNLMLVTCNGIEIAIQSIVRTDEDYMVLRGRMAGTDHGRVLFMPFNQITYIGFQRVVKEAFVRKLFGEPEPEPAAAPAVVAEEPKPEEKAEPAPAPEPAPKAEADAPPPPAEPAEPAKVPTLSKSGGRIVLPAKSALLERMKARSQAAAKQPTNP